MTEQQHIRRLASLLRAAHCTLDVLAGRLSPAERERVMDLCDAIRGEYLYAFERVKMENEHE
jgi:hypothetical protein